MAADFGVSCGHTEYSNIRFEDGTRHIVIFEVARGLPELEVFRPELPIPYRDMAYQVRLFLTDAEYKTLRLWAAADKVRILHQANVINGYADRFPYAARNARKKQLHILHMEFSVCGEVIDEYGDVCCEDIRLTLDRKEHTVALQQEDETTQVTLTEKDMRKLLNVIVNNYEVFCWEDDYGFSNAADTDALWEAEWEAETPDEAVPEEPEYEDSPSWKVSVRYTNGEAQGMCGYDDLPDRVNELALELLALFEDEPDLEADESDSDPDVR